MYYRMNREERVAGILDLIDEQVTEDIMPRGGGMARG
jgi:hypothetical protein